MFKTIEGKLFKGEDEFLADFMKINSDIIPRYYKPRDIGSVQKPFDVIGIMKGQPLGIEFKLLDKDVTDKNIISSLRYHQITNLLKFKKSGGNAFVIIYTMDMETKIFSMSEIEKMLEDLGFQIV